MAKLLVKTISQVWRPTLKAKVWSSSKNQTEIVTSSEIQNALDKRYFKIKMVAKLLAPNPPQEGLITKDLFYGKGHAMKSCETFKHKSNKEKLNGLCFGCLGKKITRANCQTCRPNPPPYPNHTNDSQPVTLESRKVAFKMETVLKTTEQEKFVMSSVLALDYLRVWMLQ